MGNGYVYTARETGGYGVVPSSGWRDLEPTSITIAGQRETLQHRGLRAAGAAPKASGRRTVKAKSSGGISFPFYSNGLGQWLWGAAGTATSGVHSGGAAAYDQVFTWTSGGPPLDRSLSVDRNADRYTSTTVDTTTFRGLRVTNTEIGSDTDNFVSLAFTVDGMEPIPQGANPSRSATAVDPDFIYAWEDASITLTPTGGSAITQPWTNFGLTLPTNMLLDQYALRRSTAEVQTITKSGTWSGGTYTLTVLGVTTAAIAYNANAATINTALATAGVPTGHVVVTGGPISSSAITLTYKKSLGNVAAVTIDTASVTGSTPGSTVATATAGADYGRLQPKSKGAPTPTGTLSWLYDGPSLYNYWISDQEFSLSASWEAVTPIEGTTKPSLTIDVPSLFLTGEEPQLDIDNPTMQSLPFEITQNAAGDPACTITVVTSDTDY